MITLSSCRAIGFDLTFSPEQAAIRAVRGNIEPNVTFVDDSLVVHQSIEAQDDLTVVVMSFKQLRAQTGEETCLYTYEVQRMGLGWAPKSGGGGCYSPNQIAGQEPEEIQLGAGQSISDAPGDLGFSQVYGKVNNPEIVKVRITWNDDTADEVEVINSTFVAYRFGMFNQRMVEGLNEQGEVVYSFAPQIAPGKEQ